MKSLILLGVFCSVACVYGGYEKEPEYKVDHLPTYEHEPPKVYEHEPVKVYEPDYKPDYKPEPVKEEYKPHFPSAYNPYAYIGNYPQPVHDAPSVPEYETPSVPEYEAPLPPKYEVPSHYLAPSHFPAPSHYPAHYPSPALYPSPAPVYSLPYRPYYPHYVLAGANSGSLVAPQVAAVAPMAPVAPQVAPVAPIAPVAGPGASVTFAGNGAAAFEGVGTGGFAGDGVAQFRGQFPAGVFGGVGDARAELNGSGQIRVLSNQAGTVGTFQNFNSDVGFAGQGFARASGGGTWFGAADVPFDRAINGNGVTTIRGGRSYNPYGYNRYAGHGGYGYGNYGRYVSPYVRPSYHPSYYPSHYPVY